jgi:5,8-dihydroxy-2-naphthoate synthase
VKGEGVVGGPFTLHSSPFTVSLSPAYTFAPMPQTIRVAHSPDSDDAFMFYALAEGKIDTGDLRYVHELSDIESLNQRARRAELEVTAVSIHAYAYIWRDYALLGSGSSMGDGYGPRLVSLRPRPQDPREALRRTRVGVPGRLTTAYLGLKLYQPDFIEVVLPFDQIEEAVLRGEVDAGLLIHEGQLTYGDRGLQLWTDLGVWWLGDTGLPLPLGGNAVRRDLGPAVTDQIARDLRASIVYALEHRAPALAHAKQFNRGIGDERTDTFVGMYVNQWTVDYGPRGRQAVQLLLDRGYEVGLLPERVVVEFVG